MRVSVRVSVCVRFSAPIYGGFYWRKGDQNKKGGRGIIGFGSARRHNDSTIDGGMGSRLFWTNGGAGGCFSQPLIGWRRDTVGLQVAKSEHLCHPSWKREEELAEM